MSEQALSDIERAAAAWARMTTDGMLEQAAPVHTAGLLMSGLLHAMGTPLNVAMGRVRMVESERLPLEERVAHASPALVQLRRMTELLHSTAELLHAGPQPPRPISLISNLNALLDRFGPLLGRRGGAITVQPGDEVVAQCPVPTFERVMLSIVVARCRLWPGESVDITVLDGPPRVHFSPTSDVREITQVGDLFVISGKGSEAGAIAMALTSIHQTLSTWGGGLKISPDGWLAQLG